jgi:hypothetical protein
VSDGDEWKDEPLLPPGDIGFSMLHLSPEEKAEEDRLRAERVALGDLIYPTLPLFRADTACAKCGHARARAQYMTHRFTTQFGSHDGIIRTCKRCRYMWPERALDSEAP